MKFLWALKDRLCNLLNWSCSGNLKWQKGNCFCSQDDPGWRFDYKWDFGWLQYFCRVEVECRRGVWWFSQIGLSAGQRTHSRSDLYIADEETLTFDEIGQKRFEDTWCLGERSSYSCFLKNRIWSVNISSSRSWI